MSRTDQKRHFKLIPLKDGLDLISKRLDLNHLGYEIISIGDSLGRVLVEDISSEVDIPSYNRASMDGYAVMSQDTGKASSEVGIKLRTVGKLFPEDFRTDAKIESGQAIYVTCGAPLPKGADAVIKVEETRLRENAIDVLSPVAPFHNVSQIGEDLIKENIVIHKGSIIRAQELGILAALRKKRIKVFKKPSVAILSIGDELTDLSTDDPNKLVNNYAFIISGLVSEFRAVPFIFGPVADNPTIIKNKIKEAIEKADVIITIGGCSVGIKDFVPEVIYDLGVEIVFHGITISPGKVTGFGIAEGKPIIMLPGMILSTIAGFFIVVAPILNSLSGLDERSNLPTIEAELTQEIKAKKLDLFQLLNVKKVNNAFQATPIPKYKNVLIHLIKANGFTIVQADHNLNKGDKAEVKIFNLNTVI